MFILFFFLRKLIISTQKCKEM
ncbi:hypothetical protein, partial [Plasmodium yoelii yoelii]